MLEMAIAHHLATVVVALTLGMEEQHRSTAPATVGIIPSLVLVMVCQTLSRTLAMAALDIIKE